jgi:predicted transcriptional regulator
MKSMKTKKVVSVRLDEKAISTLDRIADDQKSSRSFVAGVAILLGIKSLDAEDAEDPRETEIKALKVALKKAIDLAAHLAPHVDDLRSARPVGSAKHLFQGYWSHVVSPPDPPKTSQPSQAQSRINDY